MAGNIYGFPLPPFALFWRVWLDDLRQAICFFVPLQQRIADVSDEMELDEVYSTERQLLYVAATRARDRLLISGVAPGSEFLSDMMGKA